MVTLANLAVNWAALVGIFVKNSDTLLSEFIYIEIGDAPLALAATVLQNVGYILADGLLVSVLGHYVISGTGAHVEYHSYGGVII